MRCAIYTRVSTDEQARSEYSSLERQKEVCASYIEIQKEKGWHLAGVYEDGGYSGKDLSRPGLQELLQDVRDRKIDVVVTYKIDRISRSLKDFYEFWEVLKEHGVSFVSATQHFDTSDSTGMLMLNILLSFAQFERELTRERTLSKMAGRAEKGLWNGGYVPIGFDYSKESQQLRRNEREAETVAFIFRRLVETRSPSTVANEANSLGYRTKRRTVVRRQGFSQEVGGKRFDEDTVKAIVRNPIYKGFIRYNGDLYPGNHEPIVDQETWEQANRAIGNGREGKGLHYKDDHVHLLKGILRCGPCGLAMTPYPSGKKTKDGRPYLYYACTSVTQDGSYSECSVRALPAREFEALIKQVLTDLGNNPSILQSCVDAANRDATRSLTSLQNEQRRHQEEIGKLTIGIRRIIEVMKQEDMLSEDVREEYKQLVREKERLLALCEKLQLDIERRQKRVVDAEIIRRSLQDFERLVNLLPLEDQKELFQLLIREVEVHLFDPAKEKLPKARGAFATRVRSKWYRVNVTLHQLPGVDLGEQAYIVSSDNKRTGSPARTRTWNLAVNSRPLYRLSYRGSRQHTSPERARGPAEL